MISPCFDLKNEDCSMAGRGWQRRANSHHLYYPANDYTTELEQAFRNLPQHIIQLCVCAHDQLHKELPDPKKPSVAQMCLALTVEL